MQMLAGRRLRLSRSGPTVLKEAGLEVVRVLLQGLLLRRDVLQLLRSSLQLLDDVLRRGEVFSSSFKGC